MRNICLRRQQCVAAKTALSSQSCLLAHSQGRPCVRGCVATHLSTSGRSLRHHITRDPSDTGSILNIYFEHYTMVQFRAAALHEVMWLLAAVMSLAAFADAHTCVHDTVAAAEAHVRPLTALASNHVTLFIVFYRSLRSKGSSSQRLGSQCRLQPQMRGCGNCANLVPSPRRPRQSKRRAAI